MLGPNIILRTRLKRVPHGALNSAATCNRRSASFVYVCCRPVLAGERLPTFASRRDMAFSFESTHLGVAGGFELSKESHLHGDVISPRLWRFMYESTV
jgi:hypothetical protein